MSAITAQQASVSVNSLRHDLLGGLTAALVLLPRNMAFGLLIFLPFGPEYASVGVMAGLVSLIVSNIIAAPFAAMGVMCLSTFSLSALILMSMNQHMMTELSNIGAVSVVPVAMALCFLAVFVGGLTQFGFGALSLGNLAKYIPYPVLSGILNGTGVAIILSQVGVLTDHTALSDFDASTYALMTVGLLTCLFTWLGPRWVTRIPGVFFGLTAGCLSFFLIMLFLGNPPGPTVGALPDNVPTFDLVQSLTMPESEGAFRWLVLLAILFGIGLGAADTLRAALSCLIVDLKTTERSDFNLELRAEGLGNAAAALLGAISSTGNATGAIANHQCGARSRWSRFTVGGATFLVVVLLAPFVAMLPLAVLAAIMIVMTLSIMDFGFVTQIRQLFSPKLQRKSQMMIGLSINLIVAVLVVAVDLFMALAFGLLVSAIRFVLDMTRTIVRGQRSARELPSNVTRCHADHSFLWERAEKIQILELEGALFFGTADTLHEYIDPLIDAQAHTIIIDLKLVTEIDQTAADIMLQCQSKVAASGSNLVISGLDLERAANRFPDMLLPLSEGRFQYFDTVEDAIASAESDMLVGRERSEIPLLEVDVLAQLKPDQLDLIKRHCTKVELTAGEYLIREGGIDRVMYFLVKGSLVVGTRTLGNQGNSRFVRFGTTCAGSAVGEMAVFDQQPRSADVMAVDAVTCFALSEDDIQRVRDCDADAAYALLMGLNRLHALRNRTTNDTLARLRL